MSTNKTIVALLLTHAFTDTHGLEHAAAVMQVNHATLSDNTTIRLGIDAVNDYEATGNVERYAQANYSVCYWPSQAAKDAGAEPLEYKIKHDESQGNDPAAAGISSSTMSFSVTEKLLTPAQLQEACMAHFKSEILKIID